MKKILLYLLFPLFLYANSSVLIINSYHKGYEWSDDIVMGIEKSFYSKKNIDVNILYMDSKRVTSKQYFSNLVKLYSIQLRNRKYDLVIAIDRFAYDFVLKNYTKFFKNEKILAVGIESFSLKQAKKYNLENKVSALLEKRDLKSNINIIKALIPNIKKLYIINDKSENALHTQPLIYKLLKNFKDTYELKYLQEDNLEKLEEIFSKKDSNSAALFVRFYKNKTGKLYNNSQIANFINNSKVPMFVTDSIFVNKGAIGGKIIDLINFGKYSGNLALNILERDNTFIKNYQNLYYTFDSLKLEQFKLDTQNLKIPFKLFNQKEPFYDEYKGLISFVFKISPLLLFLILGLIYTIYKKKKIEEKLIKRIEFDAVMLNSIDSAIFWEDEKGFIVDCNKNFCSLVNIELKELIGKPLKDFKSNNKVKRILNILEKYQLDRTKNHEFKYFHNDIKTTYLIKQEKLEEEKAKRSGFVTIFTDITNEKQIQKEKQKNQQFIIQQSKLAEIGEVFSSIAHQWKTPLIEITTIAQELFYSKKYDNDLKEKDSFVKDIMTQVDYMNNTINTFQNFILPSKEKKEFDVYEAIKSTFQIVNHNIKYNNIIINIDVKNDTNTNIIGYKNEFMQVFLNIINNAKEALLENNYKNRNINITLYNENKHLILEIKDNGKGIKEKNINKIFKAYHTTKKNGHGIGLYMSKVIIEDKMDGKIEVKNFEDGALFKITLRQDI